MIVACGAGNGLEVDAVVVVEVGVFCRDYGMGGIGANLFQCNILPIFIKSANTLARSDLNLAAGAVAEFARIGE